MPQEKRDFLDLILGENYTVDTLRASIGRIKLLLTLIEKKDNTETLTIAGNALDDMECLLMDLIHYE